MGALQGPLARGVCSPPLTSRGEGCAAAAAAWKMEVVSRRKCFKEAMSSNALNVHAPQSGLQDLGVVDYFTVKLFSHLKRCSCAESVQCFQQLTAAPQVWVSV